MAVGKHVQGEQSGPRMCTDRGHYGRVLRGEQEVDVVRTLVVFASLCGGLVEAAALFWKDSFLAAGARAWALDQSHLSDSRRSLLPTSFVDYD
jgi:hypothetical protein